MILFEFIVPLITPAAIWIPETFNPLETVILKIELLLIFGLSLFETKIPLNPIFSAAINNLLNNMHDI